MILVWRGWGLLAVVALFPLLASCTGLIGAEPKWKFQVVGSLCLLVGGAVCVYFGTRWNRNGVEHSLYFLPLQIWGWLYLAGLGAFAVLCASKAIERRAEDPLWRYDVVYGVVCLVAVVASGVIFRRLALRAAQTPSGSEKFGFDRPGPGNFRRRPGR